MSNLGTDHRHNAAIRAISEVRFIAAKAPSGADSDRDIRICRRAVLGIVRGVRSNGALHELR